MFVELYLDFVMIERSITEDSRSILPAFRGYICVLEARNARAPDLNPSPGTSIVTIIHKVRRSND